jgi:hypothetical protein
VGKIIDAHFKGDNITKSEGRHRAQKLFSCPKGFERHHIDGNPLNNNPSNIQIVTRKEHLVTDGRIEILDRGRLIHNITVKNQKRGYHGRFIKC